MAYLRLVIMKKVINPINLLSLWFTPQLLKGVDHKDSKLDGLITFFSLLLILNTLCRVLIHI